jgi:hypothetical protein
MTMNRPFPIPAVLGGIITAMFFCLLALYAVPRFEAIFADMLEGASLPVATRLMLGYGQLFLVLAGLLLGLGLAVGGAVRELRWLRWVCVLGTLLVAILVVVSLILPLLELTRQLG